MENVILLRFRPKHTDLQDFVFINFWAKKKARINGNALQIALSTCILAKHKCHAVAELGSDGGAEGRTKTVESFI